MQPIEKLKVEKLIRRENFDVPLRKCELCGTARIQDEMMNVIICIGSPGHPNLPPFQCPEEEHWGCCLAHIVELGKMCLDQHIGLIIAHLHMTLEQGIHKQDAQAFLETNGYGNKPNTV